MPTDEPVRRIVEAVVNRALARCDCSGISRGAFYQAMLKEQQSHPEVSLSELIDRTFRRLAAN